MKCIKCGCVDENCGQCVAAQGEPCHWVADGKCSRCFDEDGKEKAVAESRSKDLGLFSSMPPFWGNYNCTYTTSTGSDIKTSLPVLMEIMKSIPEKPTILTMSIEFTEAAMLPPNTILLSSDIANALEQAMNSVG